ncbi:hypothetical protein D3P07_10780 [Paenibacillus sp. 1011MAR3C5]|uniref:hypothetical protein n=1 Tax=Paenibacillus sp. 1011MAR3C5 TaxID=1675787 RepID=UPI000E6B5574|nr:hypothetical protein [Paenibacillus sp. 1011MAR3C5]RJE88480.1 hypothetical protein D3P07_10780 [Paenibacillus sp. 1011MAR3C5]
MSSLIGVIALAAAAVWLEVPRLLHREQKRELAIFFIFLAIGVALYSALVMEVSLPNPFVLVKMMFGWAV